MLLKFFAVFVVLAVFSSSNGLLLAQEPKEESLPVQPSSPVVPSTAVSLPKDSPETAGPKKGPQVIDFSDDTIEGDLTKPDGEFFNAKKRAKHQKLIKVREHFRLEILQSIQSL